MKVYRYNRQKHANTHIKPRNKFVTHIINTKNIKQISNFNITKKTH